MGKRATSTITGIIDGIGTSGTGLGQVVLGKTIEAFGWFYGFLLIIAIMITCALLPLGRVFVREMGEIREIRRMQAAASAEGTHADGHEQPPQTMELSSS